MVAVLSVNELARNPNARSSFSHAAFQNVIDSEFVSDMLHNKAHDAIVRSIVDLGHNLGLQVVAEVHSEADLERALRADAAIIGINNRDLVKMKTDKATTTRLRPMIPAGRTVISESGIESHADIDDLLELGVDAALVGESLLRAPDLEAKLRELTGR